MSSLTCITCRVYFINSECQKNHYKSEWHLYNLKRKVVNLDAIDFDSFTKLKQNQIDLNNKKEEKEDTYCKCCRKYFTNKKALEQHYQSKKHKDLEAKFILTLKSNQIQTQVFIPLTNNINKNHDEASDFEDWEDIEDDGLDDDKLSEINDRQLPPFNQCLFCPNLFESIEKNVQHMSEKHSFFIPDVEFLVDLNSLLKYLAKKIFIYHQCLWCNDKGKTFYSCQAVQKHMISKGHFKIQFDSLEVLLEYSPFYDYSSSYPDNSDNVDEEVALNEINCDDNWELTLPSGSVIGHRSLFRYYKQNLKPVKENTSSSYHYQVRKKALDKVISCYRSLGWNGTKALTATQRAKDIKCLNRYMSKRLLDIGLKHNKTLQPHFRNQVFF